MTAVTSVCVKRKLIRLLHFCEAILLLKMEENKQHFWRIMLYYFKKGKNATKMQEKICVEKVLCLIERVRSVCEVRAGDVSLHDAPRSGRQLKSTAIKSRHELRSTSRHAGDSRHSQNTPINPVSGKHEKCVFHFMEKPYGLSGPPSNLFIYTQTYRFLTLRSTKDLSTL